jgi:hypothetical protein
MGFAGPVSAENSQCERLFDEPQEISTCYTLLGLRNGPVGDLQLREDVSRQVHGVGYADAMKAKQERKAAEKKAAEDIARESGKDQCGRVFNSEYERDVCRWQSIFSTRTTDQELHESVLAVINAMKTDSALKEQFISAIRRMRTNDVQDRIYAEEARKQRAAEARKAEEAERRRAEIAKVEAQRRSAVLGRGRVGFLSSGWNLSGFGTVLITRFLLQNNGADSTKDFEVACDTFGESGTHLSSVRAVLYAKLAPGERRSFELNVGVVHPQSAQASCSLVGWK